MSHYAKVVSGTVTQVMVADEEFFDTFVDSSPGDWLQTSYNTYGGVHGLGGTPFRMNFAAVGHTYDPTLDAFISKKPYPSWVLKESSCLWIPPVPFPDGDLRYSWDESTTSWVARDL